MSSYHMSRDILCIMSLSAGVNLSHTKSEWRRKHKASLTFISRLLIKCTRFPTEFSIHVCTVDLPKTSHSWQPGIDRWRDSTSACWLHRNQNCIFKVIIRNSVTDCKFKINVRAPRQETVLGKWRHSSTWSRSYTPGDTATQYTLRRAPRVRVDTVVLQGIELPTVQPAALSL
jgi:hypothetical protein